jgi:hypothetical protein
VVTGLYNNSVAVFCAAWSVPKAYKGQRAGVSQGSVLSPTLYSMYINDAPQTPGVYLSLFAYDTCLYATDRKEGFVVTKLQRGFSSLETCLSAETLK